VIQVPAGTTGMTMAHWRTCNPLLRIKRVRCPAPSSHRSDEGSDRRERRKVTPTLTTMMTMAIPPTTVYPSEGRNWRSSSICPVRKKAASRPKATVVDVTEEMMTLSLTVRRTVPVSRFVSRRAQR